MVEGLCLSEKKSGRVKGEENGRGGRWFRIHACLGLLVLFTFEYTVDA